LFEEIKRREAGETLNMIEYLTMIIIIPLGSIFIIKGFWRSSKGIAYLLKAYNSMKWDSITCTIIQSTLVTAKDDEGFLSFEAIVKYKYGYKGNQYIGDEIYFGYNSSSVEEKSSNLLRSYPEGKEVEVFVNPKRPQDSILIPGIKLSTIIPVLGGFFFTFVGFFILLILYLSGHR
jgi:hypothetical protein